MTVGIPRGRCLPLAFRDVHPPNGTGPPGLEGGQMVHQLAPRRWGFHHHLVHARRVLASIDLRNPPYRQKNVGVATQHELLERADLTQVVRPCRPKDALSQVADDPVGPPPIDGGPVGSSLGSVCRPVVGSHLTCPSVCSLHNVHWVTHPAHVSGLSAQAIRPYPPSYGFPLPFGWRHSLLGPSCARWGVGPSFRRSSAYWP